MGTYYDCKINDRRESKKIDAYLAEIDEVSKKHGFCIIFKIEKESFAITDYNEDDIKYISCANIDEECDNDQPTKQSGGNDENWYPLSLLDYVYLI